jgi:hypothetical protein
LDEDVEAESVDCYGVGFGFGYGEVDCTAVRLKKGGDVLINVQFGLTRLSRLAYCGQGV